MLVILKSGNDRVMVETRNLAGVVEDSVGVWGDEGAVYLRLIGWDAPLQVDGTFEEVCAKLGFTGSFAP